MLWIEILWGKTDQGTRLWAKLVCKMSAEMCV